MFEKVDHGSWIEHGIGRIRGKKTDKHAVDRLETVVVTKMVILWVCFEDRAHWVSCCVEHDVGETGVEENSRLWVHTNRMTEVLCTCFYVTCSYKRGKTAIKVDFEGVVGV